MRQVRSGAYRVNFRDGNETTAHYTDKLEDAVKTARLRWVRKLRSPMRSQRSRNSSPKKEVSVR